MIDDVSFFYYEKDCIRVAPIKKGSKININDPHVFEKLCANLKKLGFEINTHKNQLSIYIKTDNTNDTVDVTRCSKCIYGRPIDNTKCPEKYYKDDCVVCECEDVVGCEPMIYPPNHFCSYGKKKSEKEGV